MAVTFSNSGVNINTPEIDVAYLKAISFDNQMANINFNTHGSACSLINMELFASLKLAIPQINGCAELQKVVNKAAQRINVQIASIIKQQEKLAEMALLTIIPSDPLTWIIKYIVTVLKPMLEPEFIYLQQHAALIEQVAEIAAMVEAAASVIEGGCDINIPIDITACIAQLKAGLSGNLVRTGLDVGVTRTPVAASNLQTLNVSPTTGTITFGDPNANA
jgi:hypothetical protein